MATNIPMITTTEHIASTAKNKCQSLMAWKLDKNDRILCNSYVKDARDDDVFIAPKHEGRSKVGRGLNAINAIHQSNDILVYNIIWLFCIFKNSINCALIIKRIYHLSSTGHFNFSSMEYEIDSPHFGQDCAKA